MTCCALAPHCQLLCRDGLQGLQGTTLLPASMQPGPLSPTLPGPAAAAAAAPEPTSAPQPALAPATPGAAMPASLAVRAAAPTPAPVMQPASAPAAPAPQPAAVPAMRECAVCLEEMPASELMALVPCGHRELCTGCAQKLMAGSRCCPVCRSQVRAPTGRLPAGTQAACMHCRGRVTHCLPWCL